MAISVLGALGAAHLLLEMPPGQSTTIAFLTLAMAQLWHVFTMRNRDSGWVRNEITRNPWIWGALGLCMAILLVAVYWPPLAQVLSLANPGRSGWALAAGASLVPLLAGQLSLISRKRRPHDAKESSQLGPA